MRKLFLLILCFLILTACSSGEKAALTSVQHAQADVAEARASGVNTRTGTIYEQAARALQKAEINMGLGNYGVAKEQAEKAIALADKAQSDVFQRK